MISSVPKPASFRFVAYPLNHLCYRVIMMINMMIIIMFHVISAELLKTQFLLITHHRMLL
jgi:hypothetical protein